MQCPGGGARELVWRYGAIGGEGPQTRVSFETSFDSIQAKLEPKLVSALSEMKCLFRLFHFYTETESFNVSIEPKQTKTNRNSLIGRKFCYFFFTENLGFLLFFVFFLVFFGLFGNSLFWLFHFYNETESFHIRFNRNKQKIHPKSLKESVFG
jgi:hypothetical protein